MAKQGKRASSGPTRRKVLITALAAGAGVAGSRVLGLRGLNTPAAVDALDPMAVAMDPMGMYGATGMGADDFDGSMGIPDDSFFGPQDLDGSVLPERLRPAVTLPPVAASPKTVVTQIAPPASQAPVAMQPPITGINPPRLALDQDWLSPLSLEAAKITHLLRRTTFGYTDAELDRALSDGYTKTVERLIETPFAEPPAFTVRPPATPTPRPTPTATPRPSGAATASPTAMPVQTVAPTMAPSPTPVVPMTNNTPINIGNLQVWWIDWMTQSPTPFGEKMTLFWHGHFTSDYRKVGTNSPAIYWQNLTWRKMAMGDLKSQLMQVTPDLAMLRYLDLAVSTGRNPNENYARELMELFTLGVGNYTEDDVKAAARALAGWRLPNRNETTAQSGIFDRTRAYTQAVTFLGKTGVMDAAGVVDQILASDATATFLAQELARSFVSPGVTDAYIARLADTYRRSRYDTKALLRAMFMSPEFTSEGSFRALIKSPIEFMVSSAKALGATNLSRTINGYGSTLGMNLFDPPSVAGWGDNASWISSNTMLQRANYVSTILGQLRTVPTAIKAHERHLDGVLGGGTVQELNNARDDRSRWFAVFMSPEFQLK
jgi:uncharacterized protein (DUF1800 family)